MLNCPICGKVLLEINRGHLKKHNLTEKEFEELYPEYKNKVGLKRFFIKGRLPELKYRQIYY